MEITIGRVVLFKLSAHDAEEINRRRTTPNSVADRIVLNQTGSAHWPLGAQAHIGNHAEPGEEYPMIVTRVWQSDVVGVNGQVLLDGNDCLWVTSVQEGNSVHQWHWPMIQTPA